MNTHVLPEYLGTIDAQVLLQTLENTNLRFSPSAELLQLLQKLLVVDAEVEYTWAEGADPHHERAVSKRFARIVVTPDEKPESKPVPTAAEFMAAAV